MTMSTIQIFHVKKKSYRVNAQQIGKWNFRISKDEHKFWWFYTFLINIISPSPLVFRILLRLVWNVKLGMWSVWCNVLSWMNIHMRNDYNTPRLFPLIKCDLPNRLTNEFILIWETWWRQHAAQDLQTLPGT